MRKLKLLLTIIFCLGSAIVFAQAMDELNPIPAFWVETTSQSIQVLEQAKALDMVPISLGDYQWGLFDVPKNKIPFVLLIGSQNSAAVLVSNNANLPQYHKDYDPVALLRAVSLKTQDLPAWWQHAKGKEWFRSDGEPKSIFIPNDRLTDLFTYAPSDNMVILVPTGFPFATHKYTYLSKKERMKTKKVSLRGLHVTYDGIATKERTDALITNLKKAGLDTLVIDYKTYFLNIQQKYPTYKAFMGASEEELLGKCSELQERINRLKKAGINVSLRIFIALDNYVDTRNPAMLLWDKQTNAPWKAPNGAVWVDIFAPETLLYYQKIINLACEMGPGEIQLDYIRFPTEGDVSNQISRYSAGRRPYQAIDHLLKNLLVIIDRHSIAFSADIFGIVLWDNKQTNELLGQNVLTFMRYVDEICPMVYPSHFHNGFDGVPLPGDEPYLFIKKSAQHFHHVTLRHPQYYVLHVPWIQAFRWRSPTYGPGYVTDELKALYEEGMDGFLAWNAANEYKAFYQGVIPSR